MSKTLRLEGDAEDLLEMLLKMVSSTATDPLYHISEFVQNELDAGASQVDITFFREGSKSGGIKKVVIDGNGFGFLESFEHYGSHIGDSAKKYLAEYVERAASGLSRGQFGIGIQGFRAICDELHVVNKTKEGMAPKSGRERKQVEDPDFPKMFKNRKMVLKSATVDVTILEDEDFTDYKDKHGVTYTLVNLKTHIKSKNLADYLGQNKRSELLANKDLRIIVNDGTYSEIVKPMKFSGELRTFTHSHPKEKESHKYRGLGKVEATLFFHEAKPGSKIRLDINKEPICFDITNLPEFDRPPWNTDFVEGIVEYPLLEKSPLRSGVERDNIFWPAFCEIMNELAKDVQKIIKDYEEKSKSKRDEELMRKLEKVLADVKRELDFQTWFDKKVEKPTLGPLDHIRVFPETANVPVFTTRRMHVRAYDIEGNALKEENNVQFSWDVSNTLGQVMPKKDGEAIFKAESVVGAAVITAKVKDLTTNLSLSAEIDVAVTYPPRGSGRLARVSIDPMFSKLPLDSEKEYKAVAEDEDRNQITRGVKFQWLIAYDDTNKAALNIDYGESVILRAGRSQGTIKLQVTAYQDGLTSTDFAMITVVEKKKKERKRKPEDLGLPTPDWYEDPTEIPLRHSYLTEDGTKLYYNTGHPDYKSANATSKTQRQRYIANLYAKELAKKECAATGFTDVGERLLDVLSKIDRFWF